MDSRGDFRSSPSAPLASFAGRVSRGNRNAAPARAAPRGSPIHPSHVKAGYSRTQRYRLLRDGCTALRVLARTVRGPEYRAGSTSAHKNGSPRKQGRVGHAIDRRPESASKRPAPVSRLTPPRWLGPRRFPARFRHGWHDKTRLGGRRASPQRPPETGRIKRVQEVSSVCPSEDF